MAQTSPPSSIESERAILGACFLRPEIIPQVRAQIQPGDFYKEAHGVIFEALCDLGKSADPASVAEWLKTRGMLEKAGGQVYLMDLWECVSTSAGWSYQAGVIREKATRREIIRACSVASDQAYGIDEPADILTGLKDSVRSLNSEAGKPYADTSDLVMAVWHDIERRQTAGEKFVGVATGFKGIDQQIYGLELKTTIYLIARPSIGKAQPIDSLVKTEHGWKAIGDLSMGDKLASVDGALSIVTGIFPQGRKQAYRISFSDGRSTECCSEHLWKIYCRHWKEPRILSLDKIIKLLKAKRYEKRIWIETACGHFGHNEALPIDPWVLGVLIGDGSFRGHQLRFASIDKEIIDRLVAKLPEFEIKAFGKGCDYRIITRGGNRKKGIQGVVPNQIQEKLSRLGLWDKLSHDKFIPPLYLSANIESRRELLNGLLDTDGWVSKWGSIVFTTTSKQLSLDVVELVRSLGGICSVTEKKPQYRYNGNLKSGRMAFQVYISHSQPSSLVWLPRKKNRIPAKQRLRRLTISSIEPSRIVESRCITVSHSSQLYITEQYIVTHNTALALNIADNIPGRVAYFSLESNAEALTRRRLASKSDVHLWRIRTAQIESDQFDDLRDASTALCNTSLIILDKPYYKTVENLTAQCESMAMDGPISLIVIDHIQRMRSRKRLQNRHLELSWISEELSTLAKNLNVPILILCQLSREIEKRQAKKQYPQLSDMKESGDLEANADQVWGLWREDKESEYAQLECLKGRDTGTWKAHFRFDRNVQRFFDGVAPGPLNETTTDEKNYMDK